MSSFLPSSASPRASPKRRLENGIPNLSSLDITVSSATSSASAALSGLSSKDVQLIDEIIERSPPSATTFLTVFKAYNEVLHERGMDAANDVVYYKILLKLGVVKGHDWGSKWETVKVQLGYGEGGDEDEENGYSDSVDSEKETTQIPKGTRAVGRAARGGTRVERSEPRKPLPPLAHLRFHHTRSLLSEPSSFAFGRESVTVHSHLDDGTETQTDTTEQQETIDGSQSSSSPTTLIPREKAGYSKENALHLSTEATTYPPLPTIDQFLPVQAKKKQFNYDVISNFTNHPRTRSSTPPPFEALSAMKKPVLHVRHDTPFTHPYIPPAKIVDKQSPPKDNSLNEEETWKRVRMCRDEKEADRFREVLLLERCWQVWKGGLQWLISMGEKVDTEREKTLTHLRLQKWRSRLRYKLQEYHQIGQKHNIYLLKCSVATWKKRLSTRQVSKWKDGMRKKMSLIKTTRDSRILETAWIKWRQLHQEETADMYFGRRLAWKIFNTWKSKLVKIEHLDVAAAEFSQILEQNQATRIWDFWKQQTCLRESERYIRDLINTRFKRMALETFKQRMSENHEVHVFHDLHLVKHFFEAWKRSISRLHILERKARKYQNRQDNVLLRAVFHVWTTRERSMLMDRAVRSRCQRSAWIAWKSRFNDLRITEERAVDFRNRPSSALAGAAFNRWRQSHLTWQSLYIQAVRYDEDLLKRQILLVWRVQLRVKLKMSKHAKVARKYLLTRQAWNKWREKVEDKKRQQRLHILELKFLQKHFEKWHSKASRQRYQQYALQRFEATIAARILSRALTLWTNRVIAMRLRELEVVEKRDQNTSSLYYDKWKAAYKRHGDDLRLMQSYQFVKQEEILRRMFTRWLSAAKTIRHRRFILQEREEDVKLATMEKAWDKWRERFRAERLKPLEYSFGMQMQKTRLYQAYLIWHSKTKSVPAIQFFAMRQKAKIWRVWREAMPRALKAKEARKRDGKKVLGHALDKWVQAYRTKIALKAVARARYLRLPSGAPRQSLPLSSALSGILRSSHSATSGKTTRPGSPSSDGESARGITAHENNLESDAASSGRTRRRPRPTKLTISRPSHVQEPEVSPSRNSKAGLWYELRRAQRRALSER